MITKEKYPDAIVHIGIFGKKANAHAKRQDIIAGHVFNFAVGRLTTQFAFEIFCRKTGCGDTERFISWLASATPLEFTEEQKQRMKADKHVQAAALLMQFVREGRLKVLREFGLYEDSEARFSSAAVQQVIELAETVKDILVESRLDSTPPARAALRG